MWDGARVVKNWFFHPLHWPWPVIGAIVGLYLVFTGVVFLLHQKESRDKSQDLYYRALDIRKRELSSLKLSGVEPFIWKPLFECQSLENEPPGPSTKPEEPAEAGHGEPTDSGDAESDEQCMETRFSFTPAAAENIGYHPGSGPDNANMVLFTGEIAPPCLICHPRQEGNNVTWGFSYPFVVPEVAATNLWKSDDFFYFHLIIWVLSGAYLLARFLNRRSGLADHYAAAIRFEGGDFDEWLQTKAGKSFYRNFLYAEQGREYLRGYIPKNRFEAVMKRFTSGEIPVENGQLRAGVVDYGSQKISYEGLRVAQALANKAPSGTLVVEENILPSGHDTGANKKAVWKKGDVPVYFRVVEL